MKREQLNKMCMALGLKNHPSLSNPHHNHNHNHNQIGFPTNVRSERGSSMVRPEPFEEDDNDLLQPSPQDSKYEAWMVDHPSALVSFEKMMRLAKGKKIVMFLDYDGTLSPIVDDPELAFMSDTMRSAVREVASHIPTAIISGRSRNKVYGFVQLNDVYYAGSHGMDIMARRHRPLDKKGNDHGSSIFQPAREFLPEIQKIYKELEEAVETIQGVTVEDNRFCVSVHFRRANEKDHPVVEERVKLVLGKHSSFHLSKGRKVLEIRPSIKWNKGNAVEYLLETLGLAKSRDVLPIYIGDDTTDEDAFKVIQKRGQGFAILVSKKPKETMASYSVRDPSEVLTFLLRLARWRQNSYSARI